MTQAVRGRRSGRVERVQGLYGIADVSGAPGRDVLDLADAWLAAGVTILQLRMKGAPRSAVRAVLKQLVPRALAVGCALVLNDDVLLAAEFPGLGVHLGQDDLDPRRARQRLGPEPLIGWSTHTLEQVASAAGLPVDYVGFGPVFSAAGKHRSPDDARTPMAPVGLGSLSRAVAAATVPVVAIGGIDGLRLASVMDTGVAAAAVISAVAQAKDPRLAARELVQAAGRLLATEGA